MSKPRKIRNAKDATECLAAADRAGARRVDWAHANGVDARSLNAWHVNLTRSSRPPAPLRLVELVATRTTQVAGCRVRIGEFCVEVDSVFDEALLVRVLRAVAAC